MTRSCSFSIRCEQGCVSASTTKCNKSRRAAASDSKREGRRWYTGSAAGAEPAGAPGRCPGLRWALGPGQCTKTGEQQIEEEKEGWAPSAAPGRQGHGRAPGAPSGAPAGSPRPSHAMPQPASQPQCPGPAPPASGEQPRRQQEPRSSGPGPALCEGEWGNDISVAT